MHPHKQTINMDIFTHSHYNVILQSNLHWQHYWITYLSTNISIWVWYTFTDFGLHVTLTQFIFVNLEIFVIIDS